MNPQPSAKPVSYNLKVHTMKGLQVHRGFRGLVMMPGDRTPHYCPHFHQKARAARRCAEAAARRMMKEQESE